MVAAARHVTQLFFLSPRWNADGQKVRRGPEARKIDQRVLDRGKLGGARAGSLSCGGLLFEQLGSEKVDLRTVFGFRSGIHQVSFNFEFVRFLFESDAEIHVVNDPPSLSLGIGRRFVGWFHAVGHENRWIVA